MEEAARAVGAGGRAGLRARRGLAAGALCCLLFLPSCFTFGLWGFELDAERDHASGRDERVMRYDPDTEWSWELFGFRLICTPVALALDCLTMPVQVFLWGDDGDHEPDRGGHR